MTTALKNRSLTGYILATVNADVIASVTDDTNSSRSKAMSESSGNNNSRIDTL